MTKQEQKQYLQNFVASQGTQVGLGITPLLEAIIDSNESIFVVTVENNQETTKNVTNTQSEIDAFISAVNQDPLHNTPKAFIDGVVLSFDYVEVNEDELTGVVNVDAGKYILTLSTTEGSSQLVYSEG